jgi:hypothetical protein
MILLLLLVNGRIYAAGPSLSVQVGITDHSIHATGAISSGSGQQLTFMITEPNGRVAAVDQTVSGGMGEYHFHFPLDGRQRGLYTVSIGGTGIHQPVVEQILYPATNEEEEPPLRIFTLPPSIHPSASLALGAADLRHVIWKGNPVSAYQVPAEQFGNALRHAGQTAGSVDIYIPAQQEHYTVVIPMSPLISSISEEGIKSLVIRTSQYRYELLLPELKRLGAMLEGGTKDGTETKDLLLWVRMGAVTEQEKSVLLQQEGWRNQARLLTPVAQFELALGTQAGMPIATPGIEKLPAVQSLLLSEAGEADRKTGISYDARTEQFEFASARMQTAEDGSVTAVFERKGQGIYTVIDWEKNFADSHRHWAEHEIRELASSLIIRGVSDKLFAPEAELTRAQFMAMLVRGLGLSADQAILPFPDVGKTDWHAQAVQAAFQAGLTDGYADGTFRPDQSVSRAEMAVMLARALSYTDLQQNLKEAPSSYSSFRDREAIPEWAGPSIEELLSLGLMEGMEASYFGTAELATRAQAATVVYRFMTKAGLLEEETYIQN